MKKILPLLVAACWLLSLSFVQAQKGKSVPPSIYPIMVGPIPIEGLPDIQFEAEIKNSNFCIIKVYKLDQPEDKVERNVHPFEIQYFKAILDSALNAVEVNSYTKMKPEGSQKIFHFLKGSEYVQPIGDKQPEAGRICFSKNVLVKRNSTDGYQRVLRQILSDSCADANLSKFKKEHPSGGQNLSKKDLRSLKSSFRRKYEERKIRKELEDFSIAKNNLAHIDSLIKETRKNISDLVTTPTKLDTLNLNLKADIKGTEDKIARTKSDLIKQIEKCSPKAKIEIELILQQNANDYEQSLPALIQLAEYHQKSNADTSSAAYHSSLEFGSAISMKLLRDLRLLYVSKKIELTSIELYASKIQLSKMGEAKRLELQLQEYYSSKAAQDSIIRSIAKGMTYLPLEIEYVEIEFNEGFIENILVSGYLYLPDNIYLYQQAAAQNGSKANSETTVKSVSRQRIKFENRAPMGFSRKRDFSRLRNYHLWARARSDEHDYVLRLGDLLEVYLQKHQVGRRDFSPINGVMTYFPEEEECKVLYKEETFKLFEARVYSDFVGLDDQATNGLLQTEVAKRMNINTWRTDKSHGFNFGCLSWVEPSITLSKIEQNNKYLPLVTSVNKDTFFAATLDLRRHEAFGVGFNMNWAYLDVPILKSNLMLNTGWRYGRTPVRYDSDEKGVNTFDFMVELGMDIKADERWGVSIANQYHFFHLLDRNVRQVGDAADPYNQMFVQVKDNRFQAAQFFAYFIPDKNVNGHLFFRYRYNWQVGDVKLGFHQAQLGYSFYLLGRYKSINAK